MISFSYYFVLVYSLWVNCSLLFDMVIFLVRMLFSPFALDFPACYDCVLIVGLLIVCGLTWVGNGVYV